MFQISYSPNLKWEVKISWSKNATLPIVAANFIVDNKIKLFNKPNIVDVNIIEELATQALKTNKDYFDLTTEKATKIRSSILLIPVWLIKFWKVRFTASGGCKIWKRPLDSFDKWLELAWISISFKDDYKLYEVSSKPKKNIMFPEFSVTATEALLTYLAFANNFDYDINIYQIAIEPHVQNLISYLNMLWAKIILHNDNSITISPSNINITQNEFTIISDYIEAWTYFAIWAWAENSEIIVKDFNVDDLSSMYSIASQIWIDFKILDKHNIKVNSFNKKNYKAPHKFQTRIHPWFPTDLQSVFGALFTQCNWITKIFETLYEWRFGYLLELENMWAKIEILNSHQALVIWPTQLNWAYIASTDLRWGAAAVLAGIMAKGDTFVTKEEIILRWYEDIINKLTNIWVNIKHIQ